MDNITIEQMNERTTSERLQEWATEHAGQIYERLRSEMESMEWETYYPVIDKYTRLTGAIYDGNDGQEYEIVNVRGRRIVHTDTCSDAVIQTY